MKRSMHVYKVFWENNRGDLVSINKGNDTVYEKDNAVTLDGNAMICFKSLEASVRFIKKTGVIPYGLRTYKCSFNLEDVITERSKIAEFCSSMYFRSLYRDDTDVVFFECQIPGFEYLHAYARGMRSNGVSTKMLFVKRLTLIERVM